MDWLYDRQGNPITVEDMVRTRAIGSPEYFRVGLANLGDGVVVSTVWLGIAHPPFDPDKPPMIFETMVFIDGESEICRRYPTEDEAIEGHQQMVDSVRLRTGELRSLMEAERQEMERLLADHADGQVADDREGDDGQ